ncbi:hypothetical protein KV679_02570 [Bacillus sp. JRC01]|nr:hypothetical protein [Bacillus sp. JRC01]
MLKKLVSVLLVTSLLLGLSVSNVFAAESTSSQVNPEDYKEMMEAVKDQVIQGKENEVESLPEVINFKEEYTETEINEFVQTTEAFKNAIDEEAISNELKQDLEVGMNEEKL